MSTIITTQQNITWRWPNFSPAELACKCGCGLFRMEEAALDLIQRVRNDFGAAIIINSACRCKKHSAEARKTTIAAHRCDEPDRGAWAFDISVPDAARANELIRIAVYQGALGVGDGSARGFIHIDNWDWRRDAQKARSGLPTRWTY